MSQRWLASVLLYAEEGFRTVKGFNEIPWVIQRIRISQKTKVAEENPQGSERTELAAVGS
jgi:hypothetical protein